MIQKASKGLVRNVEDQAVLQDLALDQESLSLLEQERSLLKVQSQSQARSHRRGLRNQARSLIKRQGIKTVEM